MEMRELNRKAAAAGIPLKGNYLPIKGIILSFINRFV